MKIQEVVREDFNQGKFGKKRKMETWNQVLEKVDQASAPRVSAFGKTYGVFSCVERAYDSRFLTPRERELCRDEAAASRQYVFFSENGVVKSEEKKAALLSAAKDQGII